MGAHTFLKQGFKNRTMACLLWPKQQARGQRSPEGQTVERSSPILSRAQVSTNQTKIA